MGINIFGSISPSNIYVGSGGLPVKEVYVGSNKVWPTTGNLVLVLVDSDGHIKTIVPDGVSAPEEIDLDGDHATTLIYANGSIYYDRADAEEIYSVVPDGESSPVELASGISIQSLAYGDDRFYVGGTYGIMSADLSDIMSATLLTNVRPREGELAYGDGKVYYSHYSSGGVYSVVSDTPSTPVKLADAVFLFGLMYAEGTLYYSAIGGSPTLMRLYSLVPDGVSAPIELDVGFGKGTTYAEGTLYYVSGDVIGQGPDIGVSSIVPDGVSSPTKWLSVAAQAMKFVDQKIYYSDGFTGNLYSFTPEPTITKLIDSSDIPSGYQILGMAAGDGKVYISMTDSATDARIYSLVPDGSSTPVELVNSLTEAAASLVYNNGILYYGAINVDGSSGAIYSLVPDGVSTPTQLTSSATLMPVFLIYADDMLYYSNAHLSAALGLYSLVPDGVSTPTKLDGSFGYNLTYSDGKLYYDTGASQIYSLVPDGVSTPEHVVSGKYPLVSGGTLYYYASTSNEIYSLVLDGLSSPVKIADSQSAWMVDGDGNAFIADMATSKIYRLDIEDVRFDVSLPWPLELVDAEVVDGSGNSFIDHTYADGKLYYFNSQDGCVYSVRGDKGTKIADDVGGIVQIVDAYI